MSQREHTENLSDTPRLIPPETGALARSASEEAPLIRAQRPRAFRISFNAATSQVASTVAQPDRPWTPAITFMSYPDRKFAANKKDVATIYAMLAPNDIAPWDIAFSLMSSIGPQTILIRKGEDHGETQLGTDQPGTVNIKFLSSNPWPPEISGVPMKINFAPPVAGLSIRANPPRIGLFESTEIAVQLVNEDAIGTATDENRRVWLAVDSGTGEFDSTELKIEANNYRVTTKFRPIWPGSIRLIAGSPGFRDVHTDLTIAGPTLTLILCGIGGLAGGFLAFSSQNARWPRIVIGLFTGVVLYWLLAFGLVHIPNFPHAAVFSPYSAAIIALLGGWGGTNTITFALKQVGFNW